MPATALVSCALSMGLSMAEVRRMPRNSLVMLIDARAGARSKKDGKDEVRDATQADIDALRM